MAHGTAGSSNVGHLMCRMLGSSSHNRFCSLPALGLRSPPFSWGLCHAAPPF